MRHLRARFVALIRAHAAALGPGATVGRALYAGRLCAYSLYVDGNFHSDNTVRLDDDYIPGELTLVWFEESEWESGSERNIEAYTEDGCRRLLEFNLDSTDSSRLHAASAFFGFEPPPTELHLQPRTDLSEEMFG